MLPFQRSLRLWFWVGLVPEHHELEAVRAVTSGGIAAGSPESQGCAVVLCVCRAAALVQPINKGSDSKLRAFCLIPVQ